MADVAQLVRAPGCGSGGRGFETRRLPHFLIFLFDYGHNFFDRVGFVYILPPQ